MPGSHLDDEQLESVPWDALLDEPDRRSRRWVSLAAVGVAAAAVLVSAARTLWPAAPTPVAVPAVAPADTVPPTVTASEIPGAGGEPAAVTGDEAGPLSEADLLAVEGDDAALAAAAHASWFATAYFTLDGTDRSGLAGRLPDGVALPPVDAAARSFVEAAEAVSVTRVSPSRFEVLVVLRSLSSTGGADYTRDPDRAVAITVELGPEGGAVVDVPVPAPLPAAAAPALGVEPAEAPPAVLEAATAAAAVWGTPRIEAVGRAGGAWRVLVSVSSPSGVSWPLVVWLDDAGSPVPPGG